MFFKNFTGGIHLPEEKESTEKKPTEKATPPKIATIPLSQHTGTPCEPLVKVGDRVKLGQMIGDSDDFISAPVHATVSGKVSAIEPRPHPFGGNTMSVVIESDGQDEAHENIEPHPDISELSKDDIKRIVRAAGIVGLGGGMFPAHVKISPPADKRIEHYVINGAECEPYLNADNRIMIERATDVVFGLKAMMKASGAPSGVIALEDNKSLAMRSMGKATKGEENISVAVLKTKYPQGGEKQLLKALFNKEVPSGGLPIDIGAVVSNAGTAVAVSTALKTGMPLIERVLTVTGKHLKNPSNLIVRIGTPVGELIDRCGGLPDNTRKVIMGGPMTGVAQWMLDAPVIKGTSGILILAKEEVDESIAQPCIRCARCVDACPAGILPNFLGDFAEVENFDMCADYRAFDCIECGLCSYVCPTKRNLAQMIKLAKIELMKRK